MNMWLTAAAVLLVCGVGPAVRGAAAGPMGRRVIVQNLATLLVCLIVLLLAQGYERPSYVDIGLVLALLGPAGTLVYARLLGPDIHDDPSWRRATDRLAMIATPLVVLPLCVAAGPGRAAVKLLVVGALLMAGNRVASRALGGPSPEAASHG
ncbi:monovalent cation/H+ antiporter complex subunit F [Streptomyces sp. NBC_01210]|nr:monovalent cation/H+ antiporter complex subunit F [Streptomyces sp. NBC_01210]